MLVCVVCVLLINLIDIVCCALSYKFDRYCRLLCKSDLVGLTHRIQGVTSHDQHTHLIVILTCHIVYDLTKHLFLHLLYCNWI